MVPVNHKNRSLAQDAAEGMISLLQQGGVVLVCFIAMLFITGGAPSGLAIGLTFGLSGIFVTWSEQHRLTENHKKIKTRKKASIPAPYPNRKYSVSEQHPDFHERRVPPHSNSPKHEIRSPLHIPQVEYEEEKS